MKLPTLHKSSSDRPEDKCWIIEFKGIPSVPKGFKSVNNTQPHRKGEPVLAD